ncbi:hypothetical protein PO124_34240, partial [Bacillus licheniformis]|nr:hypothetical protein [Bacillus licheniformis]
SSQASTVGTSVIKRGRLNHFGHLPGIVFDLQSSCRLYADGSGCRHINRRQRVFDSVTIKTAKIKRLTAQRETNQH